MIYNKDNKDIYQADLVQRDDIRKTIQERLPSYMQNDVMRIIGDIPPAELKQKKTALQKLIEENHKLFINKNKDSAKWWTSPFDISKYYPKIKIKTMKRVDPIEIAQAIKDKQLEVWWNDNKYRKCYCVFLSDVIHCDNPPIHEYGDTILLCEIPYEVEV